MKNQPGTKKNHATLPFCLPLSCGSSHLPGWQDHVVEVGSSLEDIKAVPHGLDLLYDEEVKQVAAKTETDYLVKAGDVKPLLPTHSFQILIPQVMMDDLPLPLMKGTVQGGLPLRADVV